MFLRPPRSRPAVEEAHGDAASPLLTPEESDDLRALLDEVDAAALAVYALHDLPSAPGHYRQAPDSGAWEHLGGALSPAEKWDLLNQHPINHGWRYASLERLGARSTIPDVRYASGLLAACQGLRLRLDTHMALSSQDLADAIRLGAAWRRLTEGVRSRSDLTFTAPDES
ncbi:hypothetical protein ACIQTU_02455 [Brevundimonas sp. NPDC090276]|uniref:hypothetical protein n=1 Tax=Brevundimonas sp. NPDC090276 TaxID=3363956 RepID=UPI00383BE7FA